MAAALRIRDALSQAASAGVARLDAMWLLAHLQGRPRSWLLAHDDEALAESARAAWPTLLARRAAGEPLAYVIGGHEFRGLTLAVTPAVLVPRPETELLVLWARECVATAPHSSAVDLGTGSGAIALALAHERPGLDVWATDASDAALAVAARNARALGLRVRLASGDWWDAVGPQRFGLAVSNPPYVAAGDPHLAALTHEPQLALTPGGDGLAALRRIVGGAAQHLLPGAWLLLEHGHDQDAEVRSLLWRHGFESPQTRPDLAGAPRCTGARWPGAK